ncbi:MAG TPA: DUF423 domain-containing protein [Rhodospirillaceae bacterium]|nr:DUF423 domain-containing protein [Rhodospirillaceae bacterium]
MRWILVTAAIFGASSVIIGAALRHLGGNMDMDVLQTALRYHQLYSSVLLALGLYALNKPLSKRTIIPAVLFTSGILIFSGSLYAMAVFNMSALGQLAPVGGLCFIAGWLSIAFIRPSKLKDNGT